MVIPSDVRWLYDEAGLRPPAIIRVLGVTPTAFACWCAGAWAPTPTEVPLLAAVATVQAHVNRALPDQRARCRWWAQGQRVLGWLSPAELLRRGKIGEVLLLVAALGATSAGES